MKVILPGYELTKTILSANSYLINKYFPGFDVYFLNYGTFDGKLYCGQFVSLDTEQKGGANSWAKYTINYLETLDDDLIIFADGDFFITRPYDKEEYEKLLEDMKTYSVGFMSCGEDPKRFSRIAQYAIWDREFLLDVLKNCPDKIISILKLESRGGRYINNLNKTSKIIAWRPVVNFDRRSAISQNRGKGKVAVGEMVEEDVNYLIKEGHLPSVKDLVLEHPRAGWPVIQYVNRKT